MHNNIMATGLRNHPPMLATGRYPQWRSRPNGDTLRKHILSGPYKPTTVLVQAVDATDASPAISKHTTVETPMNMSPENKAHFQVEKEAIHLILIGIGDEIYSTVDACQTAQEMWEAIKTLQQEWSRFVTIVKKQHKLDEVSYQKLFDILKQYQKEVNELRAERLARNANPLALVATAQANQDPYYQISNDTEQAQSDKDMQKNLALIAKYFKKIYKPTNNNLRTSLNLRNKNVDTTPQYKNNNQFGQFGNQRMVNVAGARENVGSLVVQQSGIQFFNCKEFGDFAKECRKPKREVPTADSGTDFEPLEQVQNEAGYNVFANDLKHSEQSESVSNTCLVETDDSNIILDSPDMCDDDIQNEQNDVESYDERVTLANLIANLKLDVDENKKIQKKLKKANTTLAQELIECKTILVGTSKTLGESNIYVESLEKEIVELESDKAEFSNMYDMILQECVSNDVMCSYLLSLSELDALAELQCLYLHKVKECDCLAQKLSNQTESVSKEVHTELLQRFAKVEKHSISLEIALQKCKEQECIELTIGQHKQQSPQTVRNTNPHVSTSTRVNHKTNISRPHHKSNQLKDKVLPNNSQVKPKKTQVEEHLRISSISNNAKSVTACNDSLNSKTSNVNVVCATYGKCLVDSNHFSYVMKMLNDVC
nr:hypothetical protein [Tanacetum cinerariifolium]